MRTMAWMRMPIELMAVKIAITVSCGVHCCMSFRPLDWHSSDTDTADTALLYLEVGWFRRLGRGLVSLLACIHGSRNLIRLLSDEAFTLVDEVFPLGAATVDVFLATIDIL